MVKYLKAYFEPKSKVVHKLAFDSAKAYFKNKEKTMVEFQAYQRGYINAYRRTYAQTKLSMEGK
jgi:hypothetical protein